MLKVKSLALPNLQARSRTLIFAAFLSVAIFAPSFIHSQTITGPLVNFLLFTAVVLLGPFEAVLIGIIPSAIALSSGLLPLPLAPMVPFIMIGNALLVAVFYYTKNRGFITGVIFASLLKFLFLHSIVALLMGAMIPGKLVTKLAVMMSWPQFITAVAGGLLAYVFLKRINKL